MFQTHRWDEGDWTEDTDQVREGRGLGDSLIVELIYAVSLLDVGDLAECCEQ